MTVIGFTGSRTGMTDEQALNLEEIFGRILASEFHHGCCVGSDEQAAELARDNGLWIVGHPPIKTNLLSKFENDDEREPLPYLTRNRKIVDAANMMIATPGTEEEFTRSGTWATIRYSREMGVLLHTLFPSGRITTEGG